MNDKIKQIAFLQAFGIACYVAIFATTIYTLQIWSVTRAIEPHPALAIALFLLTFILSALICGSIMFAYPIIVFSRGQRTDALKIILWSILWLGALLVLFGIIAGIIIISKL